MIRLALFDIDGTLIRTGGAGVQAFARTFAMVFGVEDATRGITFAGRTDSSLVRECFRKHGIPETAVNVQAFFDTYVFLLEHRLTQTHGGPCSGVLEFLEGLRALPVPPIVGLLTGNIRLGAEIKLRHFGLWDFFQTGAFGDDHEDRNHLAAIAQRRGVELLGDDNLTGNEILVVGDTPLDIACANAIRARMLAVGTGGYDCEVLRACSPTPAWVVNDLRALSAHEVCLAPARV